MFMRAGGRALGSVISKSGGARRSFATLFESTEAAVTKPQEITATPEPVKAEERSGCCGSGCYNCPYGIPENAFGDSTDNAESRKQFK